VVFAIEREIYGEPAEPLLPVRQQRVLPLLNELEAWMRVERARLSRHTDVAKAFDYMLTRRPTFTAFLHDGRICLTNNAAERTLRSIALGRKAWLFAGSDRGGERAAVIYSLIVTAKLNDVDPRPGSPTCLPASQTIRSAVSTSCCPGTGASQPPFTPLRLRKGCRRSPRCTGAD
jgi:transposase